jgi:diaminopimelate decarboxylase
LTKWKVGKARPPGVCASTLKLWPRATATKTNTGGEHSKHGIWHTDLAEVRTHPRQA